MEARLKDFVETLTPGQLLALFMKGDGVMTDLAASARLRPGQISLLIDLMEEANPSWSPDVAYQLIANQDCTPEQLERLIGWRDDSGTWDIAMERHPGGEHALVRSADPYTALRYAHHIDPDSMAGFADGIDPTTWNARQAAARLRRRHDFTREADMILKAKGL
ncbi:Uncharacterised protein [Bifidobacterium longum subsp. infantis]|uniref:Uncharacterized protein n=1 Tax=Bifidobacterium longum subsp. infantis TaxID=1682 RepID=A0A564VC01_BIFLI|nr:hypothetical protein [Bifidobacterium longum]VUX29911.1 Uncharacterised protein [Bifidobacterium longum subsp. infantis]